MRVPLSSPSSVSDPAVQAAIDVLRSGRYTMGAAVEQFEQDFAQWVGAKHAVMVNSGSSANLLAVEAMLRPSTGARTWRRRYRATDVKVWHQHDHILVPALSWSTSVWPLIQLGLRPWFVDIDHDTLAMDIERGVDAMRGSRRVTGAIAIDVLGLAMDWSPLDDIHVIEDCCESFGAHYRQKHVGTAGIMGTFSHFFSHQLTTMEGGTVVTDDDSVADDLRSMRSHGWTRHRSDKAFWETGEIDPRFLFVTTGYNVRPLELQGAMGVVQLQQVDAQLAARDAVVRDLLRVFDAIPWLEVIGADYLAPVGVTRRNRQHSWMNLPLRLRSDAPMSTSDLFAIFESMGVETRPLLGGNLLRHPALRGYADPTAFPVTEALMRDGFMIGCHPDVNVNIVADAVKRLRVAA